MRIGYDYLLEDQVVGLLSLHANYIPPKKGGDYSVRPSTYSVDKQTSTWSVSCYENHSSHY